MHSNRLLAHEQADVRPMALARFISIMYIAPGRAQAEQRALTDFILLFGMTTASSKDFVVQLGILLWGVLCSGGNLISDVSNTSYFDWFQRK